MQNSLPVVKPLWMISYDICCPKRLRRIFKICQCHGWALQKSVFVFSLSKSERLNLCAELVAQIDENEDRLLCIPFQPTTESFHKGNKDNWLLVHQDPRLDEYVF